MDGKEEHGIFPQAYRNLKNVEDYFISISKEEHAYRNLPHTGMWKIISYGNTFQFVQLKCGRDLQYPTGEKELL